MPPQKDVRYDFRAADDLSRALVLLHEKIENLAKLRRRLRSTDLECDETPTTTRWRGRNWEKFRGEFDREQAALAHLAHEAMRIGSSVTRATEEALAARTERH